MMAESVARPGPNVSPQLNPANAPACRKALANDAGLPVKQLCFRPRGADVISDIAQHTTSEAQGSRFAGARPLGTQILVGTQIVPGIQVLPLSALLLLSRP